MFRQTYQSGLLSILSSQGSKPLATWICKVSNGYVKRMTDEDTKSLVIELISTNVSSTYITCPACPHDSLGVKMQYLNLYVKNLRRYFVMEIEVLDSQNMHRRFKISTFAMKTKVGPFGTHSPLNWIEGWNRLALNLESFTKTVYGSNYVECRRITIHANCRIRRVFFADREYKEEELPFDYQIRCRIDQATRHRSVRRAAQQRLFAAKKSSYASKSDQNQSTTMVNEGQNQQMASTKKEEQGQSKAMEKVPSTERLIKTPQGSMASDLPPADDFSDLDKNSDTERNEEPRPDHQEPSMMQEMNNLSLDPEEKPVDSSNFSSNSYQQVRQRFFDLLHR